MKSIFKMTAYVWLIFTLMLLPVLFATYDGAGDLDEKYFRLGSSLYYVGYLGEVE